MKAVILAAGKGVRLEPLTDTIQKVMLPVAGKPALQVTLESLKAAGISEVMLVVSHQKEQITEYFGDGSHLGMKITYAEQKEPLGTADAIAKAEGFTDSLFLATYADEVTSEEVFRNFVKTKEQKIGARKVEDPGRFGVLEVKDGCLAGIEEKPQKPKSDTVNAGLYLFEPDVFQYIKKTKKSPRSELEVTDTIAMMVADGMKFRVEEISGFRRDICMPWHLLEVNEQFMKGLKHKVEGTVEDGAVLKPPVHVGKGSLVKAGSYIEGPVFIGEKCNVGPHAFLRNNTVLMDGARVGRAEIKNSILMLGAKCEHHSYVGDSVIGLDCNISAGTVIANLRHDGANVKMMVKGAAVDTGRRKLGCVMGSGTKTGVNCSIMPGVKVGCNCRIGPNAIVYKDLESNTKIKVKQDQEQEKLKK